MLLCQRPCLPGRSSGSYPGKERKIRNVYPTSITSNPPFLSQNLFAEKIQEYGDKKSKAGGKMVDATAATNAELQAELDKVTTLNKTNIVGQFLK